MSDELIALCSVCGHKMQKQYPPAPTDADCGVCLATGRREIRVSEAVDAAYWDAIGVVDRIAARFTPRLPVLDEVSHDIDTARLLALLAANDSLGSTGEQT